MVPGGILWDQITWRPGIILPGFRPDANCGSSRGEPLHLFTPKQLTEDFHIFRTAFEEGHPGVYRYRTKEEMDQRFAGAEKKLGHPMDVYDFFRVPAPVVAAIGCNHNTVNVSEPERDVFGTKEIIGRRDVTVWTVRILW